MVEFSIVVKSITPACRTMSSFQLTSKSYFLENILIQLTKEIPSLRETDGSSPYYISPPKDNALNQANQIHIITFYSSSTHNYILPSTPRSFKWPLLFNFLDDQNLCVYFLYSPYVLFWHHSSSATVGAFSTNSTTVYVNTHIIQF